MFCLSCHCLYCFIFFFVKQKTAYEMRISDWSSDVCSSDLIPCDASEALEECYSKESVRYLLMTLVPLNLFISLFMSAIGYGSFRISSRSEERRVGKECVSRCRSRW